jgi:3'-phosphoadenosine 5'-phosphosulfate (PAPS) 3'-phosphatase
VRAGWQRWWLVDPLDGTKEFIAGSEEFTVNIALIEQGVWCLVWCRCRPMAAFIRRCRVGRVAW